MLPNISTSFKGWPSLNISLTPSDKEVKIWNLPVISLRFPQTPRYPNGRGRGLKILPVSVRVRPGAPEKSAITVYLYVIVRAFALSIAIRSDKDKSSFRTV